MEGSLQPVELDLFHRHLLRTSCEPGTLSGIGDPGMNKQKVPALTEFTFNRYQR